MAADVQLNWGRAGQCNHHRQGIDQYAMVRSSPMREPVERMSTRIVWTRQQMLVALYLYCQIPFGKMHSRNPEIIKYAELISRTPSALAMKLTNIASLDPAITSSGRRGLRNISLTDKAMWDEMQADWEGFAVEARQAATSLGAGRALA